MTIQDEKVTSQDCASLVWVAGCRVPLMVKEQPGEILRRADSERFVELHQPRGNRWRPSLVKASEMVIVEAL